MKIAIYLLIAIASTSAAAHSDGIVRVRSAHNVKVTLDRLEDALKEKGMTIFARVDHKAGGDKVGIAIRPTELLIFGNPKIGTKLMQCSQSAALDLPQKALAFKDDKGAVWLIYNRPSHMAARHHLKGCGPVVAKIDKALAAFAAKATASE